jgi:hypothetical protein
LYTEFWCENLKESGYLEDPHLDGMIKLNWILRKRIGSMDWIYLAQARRTVANSFDHGNETLSFIRTLSIYLSIYLSVFQWSTGYWFSIACRHSFQFTSSSDVKFFCFITLSTSIIKIKGVLLPNEGLCLLHITSQFTAISVCISAKLTHSQKVLSNTVLTACLPAMQQHVTDSF